MQNRFLKTIHFLDKSKLGNYHRQYSFCHVKPFPVKESLYGGLGQIKAKVSPRLGELPPTIQPIHPVLA